MSLARRCAAVLAFALPAVGCADTPIVRNGPPQQRVISRAYRVNAVNARAKILDAFAARRSSLPPPFHRLMAIELKEPVYPPDWIAGFADAGGFLDDYRRLPAADKAQDLLLREPTGDVYWLSEYATTGDEPAPVKFQCALIVHFARREPALTEVQVYELVPSVWVGEHWALSRHGPGFGRYHDIRFVEPTVSDRVRALDMIGRLLASAR